MKRNIIRLEQTDSTNRWLHDYKDSTGEGMTVVVAAYQTAGKGQGTNKWESEPEMNLLMSVLVHPKSVHPARQFILSEAGALAVGDALSEYVDGISLKWPNDIYWNDCKISGTLIETAVNSKGLHRCIFGIGLNVNQTVFRSDAPNPVSLAQILRHTVPVDKVMNDVLDEFEREMHLLEMGREDDIVRRYHERLYRRDGWHGYRDRDGEFQAKIIRVADDGHLILLDEEGRERSYAFKEVEFII